MILYPDIVEFTPAGIWIYPAEAPSFQFSGSVFEFFSIMIGHPELDIVNARFRVRG